MATTSDNYITAQGLLALSEFGSFYKSDQSQTYINLIRAAVRKDELLQELRGDAINEFIDEVARINLLANKFANKFGDIGLKFKDADK